MANALKKITTRAKQLQKKHPNSKWVSLVKKAGAEYRAGKLGAAVGARKKKTARKKVTHKRRKISGVTKRARLIKTAKKSHAIEGRALEQLASLGAVKSQAKKIIGSKLAGALMRREMAGTKTAKRKAAKVVGALKRDYKKFC
jgi:hypothetical protein